MYLLHEFEKEMNRNVCATCELITPSLLSVQSYEVYVCTWLV